MEIQVILSWRAIRNVLALGTNLHTPKTVLELGGRLSVCSCKAGPCIVVNVLGESYIQKRVCWVVSHRVDGILDVFPIGGVQFIQAHTEDSAAVIGKRLWRAIDVEAIDVEFEKLFATEIFQKVLDERATLINNNTLQPWIHHSKRVMT